MVLHKVGPRPVSFAHHAIKIIILIFHRRLSELAHNGDGRMGPRAPLSQRFTVPFLSSCDPYHTHCNPLPSASATIRLAKNVFLIGSPNVAMRPSLKEEPFRCPDVNCQPSSKISAKVIFLDKDRIKSRPSRPLHLQGSLPWQGYL